MPVVSRKFGFHSGESKLHGTATDHATSSFPVLLFFESEENFALLGILYIGYCASYYNLGHPFSKWLTAHQRQ